MPFLYKQLLKNLFIDNGRFEFLHDTITRLAMICRYSTAKIKLHWTDGVYFKKERKDKQTGSYCTRRHVIFRDDLPVCSDMPIFHSKKKIT